jgi:hypothetical protein
MLPVALVLLHGAAGLVSRADDVQCDYSGEIKASVLGGFLVGTQPPYDGTSLAAAQAWCCAQGPRCAGVTYHGDGAGATHHYDAMAGSRTGVEARCVPKPGSSLINTSTWARVPCPKPSPAPAPPPRPPAPAPPPRPPAPVPPPHPGPAAPVVPPGTPRLLFDPPVLIGPATATCEFCGPGPTGWIRRPPVAPPAVCGTTGYGWKAKPSSVFPDCNACCDNYHALDARHWFGFNGRTADKGGSFNDGSGIYPDRLPLYFSSTAGRSWAPAGSAEAWQLTTLTGPGVMIPGLAGQLHSTGVLERIADPQTGVHVLRSPNTTVFSVGPSGELRRETTNRSVVYRGLNFSSACWYVHGFPTATGHVGSFGLRLVGAGVAVLADGTLFGTGISCLGGEAQTAKQHAAGGTAASLVGFVSSDGYTWDYRGPIYTAAAFPDTVICPTEHDITVTPARPGQPERLLVVVRADGNGLPCWREDYYEYMQVASTDSGHSWTAPVPVKGAGCVRPRLMTVGNATLLSGGRLCVENVTDTFVWVSRGEGTGSDPWRRYSLSAVHNELWTGADSLRFPGTVNSTDAAGTTFGTMSYTSLLAGPNGSATAVYSLFADYAGVPGANIAFSMRMHVISDS